MIPKIIHYIWLGGKEEPKILKKCKKSWEKFCPNYQIKRWDETNLDLNLCDYVKQAYNDKKYAFASDVFRLDILHKEGGIYLDIDVELLKPIDDLLNYDLFCGFENEKFIDPGLILGSCAKNEHIKEILDDYKSKQFTVKVGKKNQETICVVFNKKLEQMGFKINNLTQQINKTKLFSSEYFCPKSMSDGKIVKTENTYSIHHYASTWVPKRVIFINKCKQLIKRILGRNFVQKLKNRKLQKESVNSNFLNKKNYFIIHGSFGSNTEHYLPWLKEQLKTKGQVFCPSFPIGVGVQNFKSWESELNKYINNINENTVFIARSIGPIFVIKYLLKNKLKINKLISISGFNNYFMQNNNEYNLVNRSMYVRNLKNFKKYCKEVICFISKNDPYINLETLESFTNAIADKTINIEDGGHFNSDSGYKEKFEELLKYI